MTARRRRLSRHLLASHACKDCGLNVITAGEYYMVSPRLWEDKLHLKWTDNLCIGCLETRIGRKLRGFAIEPGVVIGGDFISFPENPGGFKNSERYYQRLVGEQAFAISKLKHGDPLPKGWKWKKDRGRWGAANGHMFIGVAP
jgi:hypothetical protein